MKKAKLNILKKELIFQPIFERAPSCHASTVVKMKDGRIAAAWFAGAGESNPNVRIWFSIKNGNTWDVPQPITPDDNIADWNPTLFCDEITGKLTLIYKSGISPSKWHSLVIYSSDNGNTWTNPAELVKDDIMPRGPVKNKMVRLSNGRLIAPASDEMVNGCWGTFFDLSDDNGATWTRTKHLDITLPDEEKICKFPDDLPFKSQGIIQPTVWEYPSDSGKVHMFARSSFGWVYYASSEDFGLTWSVAHPCSIPNNNSGLDTVIAQNDILALIYNPNGENWGPRYPITLAISDDNGKSFLHSVSLEPQVGEYSYPAMIFDGKKLHITYTYKRVSIRYIEAEII